MHVGLAALASGAVQVALALVLGRRFGLIGIPLASLCAQVLVLVPLLVAGAGGSHRARVSGTRTRRPPAVGRRLDADHARVRRHRRIAAAAWFPGAIVAGVLVGLTYARCARSLILGYPPVAALDSRAPGGVPPRRPARARRAGRDGTAVMEFGRGDELPSPRLARTRRPGVPRAARELAPEEAAQADLRSGAGPSRRASASSPPSRTARPSGSRRRTARSPGIRRSTEAFRQVVKAGATVLDVGANLGAYTVLLAQMGGRRPAVCTRSNRLPDARAGLDAARGAERHSPTASKCTRKRSAMRQGTARFRAIGMQGDNRLLSPGGATGRHRRRDHEHRRILRRQRRAAVVHQAGCRGGGARRAEGRARHDRGRRRRARAVRRDAPARSGLRSGIRAADLEAELDRQGLRAERLDGQPDPWSLAGVDAQAAAMRILIAHDAAAGGGGVESYLAAIMPALAARGHEVAFLCVPIHGPSRADTARSTSSSRLQRHRQRPRRRTRRGADVASGRVLLTQHAAARSR